jgi:predicted RNA-binding Zn-ribbon protein involved in translation (DUF1610 family)
MKENVLTHRGDVNKQPCMQCNGIKQAGALAVGWTVCPRCGAEWVGRDDESSDGAGCGAIYWVITIVIALIVIVEVYGCGRGRLI